LENIIKVVTAINRTCTCLVSVK